MRLNGNKDKSQQQVIQNSGAINDPPEILTDSPVYHPGAGTWII